MNSYPEFPEQVKSAFLSFGRKHDFDLKEINYNWRVIFQNNTWKITFVCEFGVVDVTVTNLLDKTEIPLISLMEFWFSDSKYYKEYRKHIYGDEKNINWIIKVLDRHFIEFKIQYLDKIKEYVEFQKLESKLITYINTNGSELLRGKFNNNSSDWKALAINEMDKTMANNEPS